MRVDQSTVAAPEGQHPGFESPMESTGVTVHVLITPREAPPALGATGMDMPFGSVWLGAALVVAGALLLLKRRAARRRPSTSGAPHPS